MSFEEDYDNELQGFISVKDQTKSAELVRLINQNGFDSAIVRTDKDVTIYSLGTNRTKIYPTIHLEQNTDISEIHISILSSVSNYSNIHITRDICKYDKDRDILYLNSSEVNLADIISTRD